MAGRLLAVLALVALGCGVCVRAEEDVTEPAMAEAQLVETAAVTDTGAEYYTPPATLPERYTARPVLTKQKNIFSSKKGVRRAQIVTKPDLQNIVQYDFDALKRSVSRASRLKRIRSGETARPKLLPAHYHTSKLVSPAQDKVTADVAGSEGQYVEPDVVARSPAAGAAPKPRFIAPVYRAASKKPLSKLSSTRVQVGPKVHIHHRRRRGARRAGRGRRGRGRHARGPRRVVRRRSNFPKGMLPKQLRPVSRRQRRAARRVARRAAAAKAQKPGQPQPQRPAGKLPQPRAPRALARRSAIRARRTRRRSRLARRIAHRRAQIRRGRARRVAAMIGRARARSATGKPVKQQTAPAATQTPAIKPADIKEADKEARQLADATATIKLVKADTTSLVMGQKQLIDYARTATRSNPIAERGIKLDETILRHIDRLEKELAAMADENKAMRALQRANLEQLKALTAKQAGAAPAAKPSMNAIAARAARNIKSFPHLRAVAVSITPDTDSSNLEDVERFAQVHGSEESHEATVDEFHASLSAGHDTESALDAAIEEQLTESESATEEVHHTDEGEADAGAKSEEEVAMEKLMGMAGSFIEAEDQEEAETEADSEEEAEEETESEEESEDEAEEESEEESEDEVEAEEEDEAEAEDEDESEDDSEEEVDAEDAEAVALIDADSTAEADIIRLAEHNAALVEQGAHRVMLQAESESESATSASSALDVETAESEAAESEAAEALGLPAVPHSVPNPVHDDLSEVAAEVESEFSANKQKQEEDIEAQALAEANAALADAPRFAQVYGEEEDAAAEEIESEAEAEVEAEVDAEAEGDSEFKALMHESAGEDAELSTEIEHELANEDAADVDIAADVEASTEDGDALEESVLDTTESLDAVEGHNNVQGLKDIVAQLTAQLGAVKAQGAALAAEEL